MPDAPEMPEAPECACGPTYTCHTCTTLAHEETLHQRLTLQDYETAVRASERAHANLADAERAAQAADAHLASAADRAARLAPCPTCGTARGHPCPTIGLHHARITALKEMTP